MIRRGVGALLVLSLTVAVAPPAQAQSPLPTRAQRWKLVWVGALVGAAVGGLGGNLGVGLKLRPYPGYYPDTWSLKRKTAAGAVTGAAIGAGIGYMLGWLRANENNTPPDLFFVSIAEGLTSATLTEGIRVAPRRFTSSQLVEACKDPQVVERVEVAPDPLEMREDGRYALNSLSVVAINAADVAMVGVPIVLEAEETSPPVVLLRSDDPDLTAGRLHAVRPGLFRMRIRTMCGTPHAEKIILGRVSP